MKVKFKFSPGQTVTTDNGLTGQIAICGVTADGLQYLVRNDYAEQWTDEKSVKSASPAPQTDDE